MKVNIISTMANVPNSRKIVSRLKRMGSAYFVVLMVNTNTEHSMAIAYNVIVRYVIIAQIIAMKAKTS
jgi:hypothetical protein